MLVSEFDYELPGELVAQQPAARRAASRLLRLDARSGVTEDMAFADFPALVGARDTLVVNDTRVIKARLIGRKRSGGKVEVFVERALDADTALALMRAGHAPRAGAEVLIGNDVVVTVEGREEDLYRVKFSQPVGGVLERYGAVPLPPYIAHPPSPQDAERYQTVYAAVPGAVAAPTAGLHFDEETLRKVQARGARLAKITLHVGAGTFQPVRGDKVEEHRMHSERYAIPEETLAAISGRTVLAVGTTSLRALETWARTGQRAGESDLFVVPGFEFKVVTRLLTNFHLPKSTLLMLACAFGGRENVLKAYKHAVRERYRFFSYGDAMLIEK
jgi:S-adenosylmethionine:tRNA ribosyltransferase-isomerase